MEISTVICQRLFLFGSFLLLFLATTSHAIINENVGDFLFTLPDQSTTNPTTKDQAQQWCIRNNNTLAEIYNSQTQDIVAGFLNRKSFGNWNFWLNGMRVPSTWVWVNERSFSGISIQQQGDAGQSYGYLQLDQSPYSIYGAYSTESKGGYICEGSSYCNGGFKYNDRCYGVFSGSSLIWYEARNQCLNGGGDLASFDFVNDDKTLKNLTKLWISSHQSSTLFWVGITRQRWTWQSSNADIKYTNWNTGYPSIVPTCLYLTPSQWKWMDSNCNDNRLYFCLRNINQVSSTSSSTTSSFKSPSGSVSQPLMTSPNSPSTPVTSLSGKDNCSSLGVGLGVGLGIGIPAILSTVILLILLIREKRLRKYESSSAAIKPESESTKPTPTYAVLNRSAQPEDPYDSLAKPET